MEPYSAPFAACRFANAPLVVIETYGVGSQVFLTDGIEVARDGFAPKCAPLTEGTVGSAEAAPIFMTGEHAIFAIDNGGD